MISPLDAIPSSLRGPLDKFIAVNAAVIEQVRQSPPWKSIFRNGYPSNDENRALIMFNSFFLHIMPVKVKRHTLKATYSFALGLMSFYLFIILWITGLLLMFLFTPTADQAYESMKVIEADVAYGQLLRNVHRWSAHFMVLFVFLHMCRVFYTGGFKPPREFNWVVGVLLLIITLLLSFTGYILVWDQLAASAITVGSNIAGASPGMGIIPMGEIMKLFMFGVKGTEAPADPAMLRLYVTHIMLLPLALITLIGVHFWRIRKDGGLSAPVGRRRGRQAIVPSPQGGFSVDEIEGRPGKPAERARR